MTMTEETESPIVTGSFSNTIESLRRHLSVAKRRALQFLKERNDAQKRLEAERAKFEKELEAYRRFDRQLRELYGTPVIRSTWADCKKTKETIEDLGCRLSAEKRANASLRHELRREAADARSRLDIINRAREVSGCKPGEGLVDVVAHLKLKAAAGRSKDLKIEAGTLSDKTDRADSMKAWIRALSAKMDAADVSFPPISAKHYNHLVAYDVAATPTTKGDEEKMSKKTDTLVQPRVLLNTPDMRIVENHLGNLQKDVLRGGRWISTEIDKDLQELLRAKFGKSHEVQGASMHPYMLPGGPYAPVVKGPGFFRRAFNYGKTTLQLTALVGAGYSAWILAKGWGLIG